MNPRICGASLGVAGRISIVMDVPSSKVENAILSPRAALVTLEIQSGSMEHV
jgi:hypothetical protein